MGNMSHGAGNHLASHTPIPPGSVRLFGIDIDPISQGEAVELVTRWAPNRPARTVITPNLDHVLKLKEDKNFRLAYQHADLRVADGMPFVWVSRLTNTPIPERVTGSDLILPVCRSAAQNGLKVFLLGTTDETLLTAHNLLVEAVPGLDICGIYAPPFGFESNDAAKQEAVKRINMAHADIVFVALGAPKQERWAESFRHELDCGVLLSIGGGLDFLAGSVPRAPKWLQKTGLEWLWRAVTEPRRLGPRYLKTLLMFPQLLVEHFRARSAKK